MLYYLNMSHEPLPSRAALSEMFSSGAIDRQTYSRIRSAITENAHLGRAVFAMVNGQPARVVHEVRKRFELSAAR